MISENRSRNKTKCINCRSSQKCHTHITQRGFMFNGQRTWEEDLSGRVWQQIRFHRVTVILNERRKLIFGVKVCSFFFYTCLVHFLKWVIKAKKIVIQPRDLSWWGPGMTFLSWTIPQRRKCQGNLKQGAGSANFSFLCKLLMIRISNRCFYLQFTGYKKIASRNKQIQILSWNYY